ncbi:MAG: glycosyltransferase family 4 protein, partial [Rhodothermia bacterium]|nr:glycosyltransferase family 4 protein [Rhodothermia bacterium]
MLDVCIINQAATVPDMPGGSRHFDLAKELAEHYGCRVTIVAAARNHLTRKGSTASLDESSDCGVRFLWIRTTEYDSNDWRRLLNMVSFAVNTLLQSKTLGRPDVIIGSSPQMLSALSALIIARRTGARFILEVRDLWPQALVDLGVMSNGSMSTRLLRWLERMLCRHASKIIVLARGSENYLASIGVPAERVEYIPNGVDLSSFQVTEERGETRRRISVNGHIVAMYAGAHGPANNLETLLDTAKELRSHAGLQIILVGDGPRKKALQAIASDENLDNVRFLDAVP